MTYRDDHQAALERILMLEKENEELKTKKSTPPPKKKMSAFKETWNCWLRNCSILIFCIVAVAFGMWKMVRYFQYQRDHAPIKFCYVEPASIAEGFVAPYEYDLRGYQFRDANAHDVTKFLYRNRSATKIQEYADQINCPIYYKSGQLGFYQLYNDEVQRQQTKKESR